MTLRRSAIVEAATAPLCGVRMPFEAPLAVTAAAVVAAAAVAAVGVVLSAVVGSPPRALDVEGDEPPNL